MQDEEVFEYYAPFIREYIYNNKWEELREVQIEAGKTLYTTENNLLVCSGTASGKTEAVFFPIISQMTEDMPESVGVIYIAPLKSLINDQFMRLDQLLEEADIPVYHWHGDVALSHKNKMIKNPKGIVQITPESLESMLINRANDIPRIFGDLRYIVIDEIHTMPGVDRGNQIICLMQRIDRIIGKSPRRIGLSATVGDPEQIARWLSLGSPRPCDIIQIKSAKLRWNLALNHYFIEQKQDSPAKNATSGYETGMAGAADDNPEFIKEDDGYAFIYDCATEKRSLIFTNSREEAEYVTSVLRNTADRRGEDDIFYIHHGDLSTTIREQAEEVLKDEDKRVSCVATVTMELGVDIGRLERVIQVSSPNTISNFLQRLGRSGRRGTPPEMLMVFREEIPLSTATTPKSLPWEMLKAIAIVQLYIEEKFIEPPSVKKMPFSLLYHQIMSWSASHGELTPKLLADNVLALSPFADVSREQFKELIYEMLKNDHLQMTEEGGIIIGLKGERILNSFKFYAVFQDFESYVVKHEAQEIGTVTQTPPVGDRFALAGRTWEVQEIDHERKIIYVTPVGGIMGNYWPGDYGVVHTKIVERIKKALEEDTVYPYLMPNAKKRLIEAREIVKKTGLFKTPLVSLGGISWAFFPWLGTVSFRTLRRFIKTNMSKYFKISNLEFEGCYFFEFKMDKGTDYEFIKFLHDYVAENGVEKESLVGDEDFAHEKYDEYIPPKLLREAFISDNLREDEIVAKVEEYMRYY